MDNTLYIGWNQGGYDERRNPYSEPAKCGLEIVEEADDPDAFYDFWMVVLWRKLDDGILYWAEDSGCSCPSPFDGVRSLSDLTPLNGSEASYQEARRSVLRGSRARWNNDDDEDEN